MKKHADICKVLTSIMLFLTAFLMLYDKFLNVKTLPDYFVISAYDAVFWIVFCVIVATMQTIFLLNKDCKVSRLYGDLTLQFAGFMLLIIGWAFIAEYPPFTILMFVYPCWGIAMIMLGRVFGKRSRYRYNEDL